MEHFFSQRYTSPDADAMSQHMPTRVEDARQTEVLFNATTDRTACGLRQMLHFGGEGIDSSPLERVQ